MQSSWWIDLVVRHGFDYVDAFYLDASSILGGAKVLVNEFEPGFCYLYIPDGPILPRDPRAGAELFQGVLTFLDQCRFEDAERRYSHVRIEPKWTVKPEFVKNFTEFSGWIEPRSTVHVDLTAPEQALLSQMKSNGRARVKKASTQGVTIVEDNSESAILDFMAIYGATAERKRLDPMNKAFQTDLMRTMFAYQCGSLYFAEYRGKRIATALIIFFGERATYFFAGSLVEFRELMAPYLLNYVVMTQAKARGFKWYDLYGAAPPGASGHIWESISVFKRNFGGVDINYIPALDYVFDDGAYQKYLHHIND